MNPIKALARLNAKTQSFEDGRGGIPHLTTSDIAAACSGLPEAYFSYAYCKWVILPGADRSICQRVKVVDGEKRVHTRHTAKEKKEVIQLMELMKAHVQGVQKFTHANPDTYGKLIRLCVNEMIDPAVHRCPKCNGTGVLSWGGGDCKKCKGTGKLELTQKLKSELIGVDRKNWERKWANIYDIVMKQIIEIETEIYYSINRRLRTD